MKHLKNIIDLALELCTILLIWGAVVLLLGSFGSCTSSQVANTPAKQQNFSTPPPTLASIPVDQIDLDQNGMLDAAEQSLVTSDRPDTLVTFGVITAAVFLITWLCAWLGARIQAKRQLASQTGTTPAVTEEDLLGEEFKQVGQISGTGGHTRGSADRTE